MNKARSTMSRLFLQAWRAAKLLMTTAALSMSLASMAAAEPADKDAMQQQTRDLLDRLDKLTLSPDISSSASALFSNQSQTNIRQHVKLFKDAEALLSELDRAVKGWKDLISKSPSNKIFYAFLATTQLAQYAIYARRDEFLAVLKLRNSSGDNNLPAYEAVKNQWEAKSPALLSQVQDTISKGLKLDNFYKDLRILQIELNVMRGDKDAALKGLDALQAEGYLTDETAFVHTWKAYIRMQQNDVANAKQSFQQASGVMEPPANAEWALSYKRALDSWQLYHFIDFQLTNFGSIDDLQTKTMALIVNIRNEFTQPINDFEGIPNDLTSKIDFAKLAEKRPLLLLPLTNRDDENMARHLRLAEGVTGHCRQLASVAENWDRLAQMNKDASFFYIMQKSIAWMEVWRASSSILPVLEHPNIKDYLQKQKQKQKDAVNLRAELSAWKTRASELLLKDLNHAIEQQPGFVPLQIARFEVEASMLDPAAALERLDTLARTLGNTTVGLTGDKDAINARGYVATWRSYLQLKAGQLTEATKALSDARDYPGMEAWKVDQEKLIHLHSTLPTAATIR